MDNDETTLQYGEWERSVDERLRKMTLIQMGIGAGAIIGTGMAFVALKGISNLAKVVGQLAEVSNNMAMRSMPPPMGDRPQRVQVGIDETPMSNGNIAEPVEGPGSGEASDKVKNLIASDPIDPKDLIREPEFRTGPMDVVTPDLPDLTDG